MPRMAAVRVERLSSIVSVRTQTCVPQATGNIGSTIFDRVEIVKAHSLARMISHTPRISNRTQGVCRETTIDLEGDRSERVCSRSCTNAESSRRFFQSVLELFVYGDRASRRACWAISVEPPPYGIRLWIMGLVVAFALQVSGRH